MIKRYILYLFRWQLSTPILAPIIALFTGGSIWGTKESWIGSIVANLIGGLVFFWVDKVIFTNKKLGSTWHVRENIVCVDCGKSAHRGYRLVKSANYDKTVGISKYRCESCSIKKAHELEQKGILLYK
jgi:hypothetical protein